MNIKHINPVHFALRNRIWAINNRCKGRGKLNADDVIKLFARYNYRCCKCFSSQGVEVDHIVPLVVGGANTIDNIQPLCVHCNASKGREIADYRYMMNLPTPSEEYLTIYSPGDLSQVDLV